MNSTGDVYRARYCRMNAQAEKRHVLIMKKCCACVNLDCASTLLLSFINWGIFVEALAQGNGAHRAHLITHSAYHAGPDFLKVNDQYGHEAGNVVLIQSAKVVRDTTRKLDIQCRYGGEEFAIILPSTERFLAIQVAQRLCKYRCGPVFFRITASLLQPALAWLL